MLFHSSSILEFRHSGPFFCEIVDLCYITFAEMSTYDAFFLQVGVLDEEKILPLGNDISAVGLCSLRNGIAEIKSCKDLPYFL